jgi:Ca2+-binding EF-hand superfamily protein
MISGISGANSWYYLSQVFRQSGSSSSSSSTSPSTGLFSSIDTNGDGTVSSSEIQAFLSSLGGTSSSSSSDGVTQSQLDSLSLLSLLRDAPQVDAATGTATSANQLSSEIDTNGGGSLNKSEFESFVSNMEASAPPPPQPDSPSSAENLSQGLEGTDTGSTAAGATDSISGQQSGTDNFLSAIMGAIGKYAMFGQGGQALTSAGLLSMMG